MLTDKAIAALKPKDKRYKFFDRDGLYIEVLPSGKKVWRYKTKHGGKEKILTLGGYPAVTLKEARDKAAVTRRQIDDGTYEPFRDKSDVAHTFKDVAEEFFVRQRKVWSAKHMQTQTGRARMYAFPHFGDKDITAITPPEVLAALRLIEADGKADTAHRVKVICSMVFRYGIACGYCTSDPCRDLSGALEPAISKPMAAITTEKEAGVLMATISQYTGRPITKCALYWSAYTFCRPGEIRKAEWSEIDWERQMWIIPAERMKMRREHIVPLPRQCMDILRLLKERRYSDKWLFPATRPGRPMSENTISMALRSMGFGQDEMSAHGFRAMASTLLNEKEYSPDIIEKALAHSAGDHIRAAYNRASYMDERRKMMQEWADYLDSLRDKALKGK